MMPLLLGEDAYLGYVRLVDEGSDSYTHLAQIDFPAYGGEQNSRGIVKIYPSASCGLHNEIIGYSLAKALSIPQPIQGAFFPLKLSVLPERPSWIPEGVGFWPAWCTSWVPKNSIKPWFNRIKGNSENPPDKKTRKAWRKISFDLNQWVHAPRTCAFDEWTGNKDRNIGNLIRIGKGNYRIIDHGQLFGNQSWNLTPPDVNETWQNKLKWILEWRKDPKILESAMSASSSDHNKALDDTLEPVLELLGDDIEDKDAKFLREFLRFRANPKYLMHKFGLLIP